VPFFGLVTSSLQEKSRMTAAMEREILFRKYIQIQQ